MIEYPTGEIRPQNQIDKPVVGDATLVDDTVELVDSLTALSGGQASIVTSVKTKVTKTVPRPYLRING